MTDNNICKHYDGEEIDYSIDKKVRRCKDCGFIDENYKRPDI